MLSKIKKSLVAGLSVVLSASLSCGVCTAAEEEPDTGCSRALVRDALDPCKPENTLCSLLCYAEIEGLADETPMCRNCNEEFQKCMEVDCSFLDDVTAREDKPVTFWEKWKLANGFWLQNYYAFRGASIVVGACSLVTLGFMYAGLPGALLAFPLAAAYEWIFMV